MYGVVMRFINGGSVVFDIHIHITNPCYDMFYSVVVGVGVGVGVGTSAVVGMGVVVICNNGD